MSEKPTIVYRTSWKQWVKMSIFATGLYQITWQAYHLIGGMLMTYGYVESLPYVQLFTY